MKQLLSRMYLKKGKKYYISVLETLQWYIREYFIFKLLESLLASNGPTIWLIETFLEQAKLIGERFVQKGYDAKFIKEKINDVALLDRGKLIQDGEKNPTQQDNVPIIMDYNIRHKQIEKIIRRHWDIIKTDRHLGTILSNQPKFVYRRAPTLRHRLAKNVLDSPKKEKNVLL